MASTTDLSQIQAHFAVPANQMPKLHEDGKEPTYTTIKQFRETLERNAMSVPSSSTKFGHLALVVSTTEFSAANNGHDYDIPVHPGKSPVNPVQQLLENNTQTHIRFGPHPDHDNTSVGSETYSYAGSNTDPQLLMLPYTAPNAIREYTEAVTTYRTHNLTETALRNMIINATDDQYINTLKDRRTLYTTVSPLELLQHLVDEYGDIEDEDRTANEARMKAQWNPPEPIETLFTQLKEGQSFALAAFETITDDQIVRWGFNIVKATGKFHSYCTKWKDRKRSEKTWKDFKSYFRKAYKNIKSEESEEKKETTTSMYTANQVQEILKQEMESFMKQIEDNKENEAPAASTCIPVKESANAATGLTADDIIKILAASNGGNSNSNRRSNRRRNEGKDEKKRHKAQALVDGRAVTYCWTHGVTTNLSHTSCTCTRRKDGHKEESTYNNRMGGSDHTYKDRQ